MYHVLFNNVTDLFDGSHLADRGQIHEKDETTENIRISAINANNFDVTSVESTRESCVRGKRRGVVDQHFQCRRMPRLSNDNKFLVHCVLDLFCIAVKKT
ncbi:uncharacterized protein LOC111622526 isoform X2 [Centruroides sculpturatus]|uniref:uncharacterized protein LOC111622526 isoform X2 n=1 Tax=Centruroides sculpturatus TaxID=218467 RepID=UPI000C6D478A|nr:uncharacterized protein LOC111622526 isoform X2 [Centruroides sculpturatus]